MSKEKRLVPELRFPEFNSSWVAKNLKDLDIYVSDGNYGELYPKADQFIEVGVPFIRVNNIKNGKIIWKDMRYISYNLHKVLKSGHLKINDILVSTRGEIGLVALVPEDFSGANINAQLCLLRVNSAEPRTVFYYLQSSYGIKQFGKMQTGSALKQLPKQSLAKININLPSLKEQQKIATFLSLIDRKIELLEKKVELLEEQKRGLLQKIFTQEIRFKKDDGSEFEEWEKSKVDELFETITRGQVLSAKLLKPSQSDENKFPVYSSQTTNNGLMGYYDRFLFKNCITWTTDGANAGDFNYRNGKFYCTNVCGVLISKKGFSNTAIAEFLKTVAPKYVSYVGNPKLMNNVVKEILIYHPQDVKEMNKISKLIEALNVGLVNEKRLIVKTNDLKKGLLQKMFI